jgi:S-(hydroxymethyl)glutathione dehydrogenase / alcohol dehydrogenase
MRGVVVRDGKLTLAEDLSIREPGPHEVSVAVQASGLCRSDLLMLEFPDPRPAVMGHEAAGIVRSVGSEVTGVSAGQMVAVTCQRPCLRCSACARGLYSACATSMEDPTAPFTWRGEPVRSVARSSSLASQIVVDELQVHPMSAVSPGAAALVGCAVSTGYGMVRNVARVQTGESVAVFGVGGIGINSIQTARLLGARQVTAVDVNPDKGELAHKFGADLFVQVDPTWSAAQIAEAILAATDDRVDAVVEGTGHPTMITAALAVLAKGGRLALVGIPTSAVTTEFNVMDVMAGHITIAGAWNGACNPFLDMPDIVRLAEQGRLDLESQITHRFPLTRYDEAIAALRGGKTLRVVVDVSDGDNDS